MSGSEETPFNYQLDKSNKDIKFKELCEDKSEKNNLLTSKGRFVDMSQPI